MGQRSMSSGQIYRQGDTPRFALPLLLYTLLIMLVFFNYACICVWIFRKLLRTVPLKSTWEGGCHFFIFLLVVGVKPYFLCWVGDVFYWWGGGGSEISCVSPSQVYLNGTALTITYYLLTESRWLHLKYCYSTWSLPTPYLSTDSVSTDKSFTVLFCCAGSDCTIQSLNVPTSISPFFLSLK